MEQIISILCSFFRREIPCLPTTYNWDVPDIEGFSSLGKDGYQRNLDFKAYLHQRWETASRAQRLYLAKVIVSDWGKIRWNMPKTLEKYVDSISGQPSVTSLKGLASYSKILSIVRPDEYAIYDARVAACLNAVQINAGVHRGIAFKYIPGRNNVVGNSISKGGFTQDARFSAKGLEKSGWFSIKRGQTYNIYLELLSLCLNKLKD